MKRWLIAAAAAAMAISMVPIGAVAGDRESNHFGPFAGTSPDGGTCGNPWANDTFDRFFTVHDNGDGTFRVREEFKHGTFVTIGPVSPGACETESRHGRTVRSGVEGKFHGYLDGTVTGGTFNASGCNATPAACTTTAGFLATTFGPAGATYTCTTGAGVCRFAFEYSAGGQDLIFHHWEDRNDKNGVEEFKGDIANA